MVQPKIFYFCYDHQKPTGGQKSIYRHVDILNKCGYPSFVLHMQKGFRLAWFDNETTVVSLEEFQTLYQPESDFLVLPEDLGEKILDFPGKKIIFNQNCYYGFHCLGFQKPRRYPYLDSDIKGVFVVSDHNREYLRFAYPALRMHRIYYGIDPNRFTYQPIHKKKKAIACLPAKNPIELSQVYHQLMSRSEQGLNRLREYEWVFIQNNSEKEVVNILRDALLFIFLSREEGFGLLPLEAMASGSLLIAYHSGAPSEFLSKRNSFLFEEGDLVAVAKGIEEITSLFRTNIRDLRGMSEKARKTAVQYSLEREQRSVIAAWADVIDHSSGRYTRTNPGRGRYSDFERPGFKETSHGRIDRCKS
jgi:hypothetical protein